VESETESTFGLLSGMAEY